MKDVTLDALILSEELVRMALSICQEYPRFDLR